VKAAGLIVAAGSGTRAGGGAPKQYRLVGGRPMLSWSVDVMRAAGLSPIVVVIDPDHRELFDAAVGARAQAVAGGAVRAASVRAGLEALAADPPDIVHIHDAARPGLTTSVLDALSQAVARGAAGAAPALPAVDALKRVDAQGLVHADAERAGLVRVQTPQTFRFAAILEAHQRAPATAFDDDLAVARAAGFAVTTIAGDQTLMKATYPEDLAMLDFWLGGAQLVAVGAGFDAHRFGPGDHVTLCGVRIAHSRGLVGHSDADAGWHALTDAILGALAQGDIGDHFPPSDPRWRGADSALFLAHAAAQAQDAGARLAHVDVTLICERPRIGPHREAMRARTAEVLGLPLSSVSVKATTTERMGFTGREEGLAAQAQATILRRP
jgi:2-C-methyl-D-erythritol 4-phosphate cytidylyltransferase/2-C-methyl-D-erythritol 2,4-cyclodiphosphate synthase